MSGFDPGVIGRATDSKWRGRARGPLRVCGQRHACLCRCIDSQIPHDCPFQVGCHSARANAAWVCKCQALSAQWLCTWLVGWGPFLRSASIFFYQIRYAAPLFAHRPDQSVNQSVPAPGASSYKKAHPPSPTSIFSFQQPLLSAFVRDHSRLKYLRPLTHIHLLNFNSRTFETTQNASQARRQEARL